MKISSGSYAGNGTGQGITGAGFAPVMVWVQRASPHPDGDIQWKIAAMGTRSGPLMSQAFAPLYTTDAITSLDADGFTVSTNVRVNAVGSTYRWVAFENDPLSIEVGTYSGNGISPRLISTTFTPLYAFVQNDNVAGAGSQVAMAMTSEPQLPTSQLWQGSTNGSEFVRGHQAAPPGFNIGFAIEVNQGFPVQTYYYFALSSTPPVGTEIDEGTYTGTGAAQTIATSPNFTPDFVLVDLRTGGGVGSRGCVKFVGMPATTSVIPHNAANAGGEVTNAITGFVATGFSVGTNSAANILGGFYRYVAIKGLFVPPAQFIDPSSIVSAEAFGTPAIFPATQQILLGGQGIPSGEVVNPLLAIQGDLMPDSIPSGEAFGTVNFAFDQFVSPTGIPSEEAVSLSCIGVGLTPTILGSAFGTAGNSTTVSTGGLSLGVQAGDLMVAWHTTDGVNRILTPPPGWTSVVQRTTSDQTCELSVKIAGVADEGVFFTWTCNISEAQCVRMFRITNYNPNDIIHRLASLSSFPVANPAQAPTVTPSAPSLVLKMWSYSRFVDAQQGREDPNDTFEGRCSAGGTGVNSAEQVILSREYLCPITTSPAGENATLTQTGSVVTLAIAGFCASPGDPVICAADNTQGILSAEAFGTPTISRVTALGSGFSPVIVAQKIKIVTTGLQPSPYVVPKPVPADFPPNREGGQGVAVGDLLVVLIATNQNNNFGLGPPPGWTLAFNTNLPPSGITTAGLYKVADAGDVAATSYSFFFTGSATPESLFLVIRGFDPTAIVHQLAITPTTPSGNPYNYPVAVSTIPSLVLTVLNNPFGYGPVTGPGLQNRFGAPGAGPVAPGGEQYDVGSPAGIANSLTQSFPGADLDDQTGSVFNTNPNSFYAFHSQPAAGTSGPLSVTMALPGAFTFATTVVWMIGGTAPPQLLCPLGIPSEEMFGIGQQDPLVDPFPVLTPIPVQAPKDTGPFFGKQNPQPLAVDPDFTEDPTAIFSVLEPIGPQIFVGKQNPEELAVNPDFTLDPTVAGLLKHIHEYMDLARFDPDDTQSDDRSQAGT